MFGSILIIVFVNNLFNFRINGELISYVDDTKIVNKKNNLTDIYNAATYCLEKKVKDWLDICMRKINTKYIENKNVIKLNSLILIRTNLKLT